MVNVFAIFFGSVAGLVVGYFSGWLFADFGWIPPYSLMWKGIVGAVTGGLFGGIAGSISGDLNRAGDSGANRMLLALLFGTIFGALGGTKFTLIPELLDSIHVAHPFN